MPKLNFKNIFFYFLCNWHQFPFSFPFSAFIRSAIKNFTIAFFFPACLTVFMFKHNRAAYDVLSNTVVVENDDLWISFWRGECKNETGDVCCVLCVLKGSQLVLRMSELSYEMVACWRATEVSVVMHDVLCESVFMAKNKNKKKQQNKKRKKKGKKKRSKGIKTDLLWASLDFHKFDMHKKNFFLRFCKKGSNSSRHAFSNILYNCAIFSNCPHLPDLGLDKYIVKLRGLDSYSS